MLDKLYFIISDDKESLWTELIKAFIGQCVYTTATSYMCKKKKKKKKKKKNDSNKYDIVMTNECLDYWLAKLIFPYNLKR